jgi:hypothetical protein
MSKENKQVEHLPFSVLNEEVKHKLVNTGLYAAGEWSFLKILEHAITYAKLKNDNKLIAHRLRWPIFLQGLIAAIKALRSATKHIKPQLKQIVVLDPVRLIRSDESTYHSIYMDRWLHLIPREMRTVVQKKKETRVIADYCMEDFAKEHGFLDAEERGMLKYIQQVLKNCENSGSFSSYELKHIGSALFIFWEDFRFYYRWLKDSEVRQLLFICHYHNEGLIAACKVNGIQTIELQHGLISRNDLYYVYDKQFEQVCSRAMFPDKLVVYGAYWRNIVLEGVEFKVNQVVVVGDYLYRKQARMPLTRDKENLLLICSQKLMHKEYLAYCKSLHHVLSKHPEWRVVVKMHPLEPRKDLYEVVKDYGYELVDMEQTLDELLCKAKIQVSIYSTTFYDAIGFDVVNFSIQNFGSSSDYAAEIVKEAVAFPLEFNEDPIKKYLNEDWSKKTIRREEVYATFDSTIAAEILDLPK